MTENIRTFLAYTLELARRLSVGGLGEVESEEDREEKMLKRKSFSSQWENIFGSKKKSPVTPTKEDENDEKNATQNSQDKTDTKPNPNAEPTENHDDEDGDKGELHAELE